MRIPYIPCANQNYILAHIATYNCANMVINCNYAAKYPCQIDIIICFDPKKFTQSAWKSEILQMNYRSHFKSHKLCLVSSSHALYQLINFLYKIPNTRILI